MVSSFVCRGYPSISALWQWLSQAHDAVLKSQQFYAGRGYELFMPITRVVVLYFGDHDPDGWEIPRSAERNLRELVHLKEMWRLSTILSFKRIALNMNQIRAYRPPAFEAKITSSRYQKYVNEHHTDEAWELDALEPRTLDQLIRSEVENLYDDSVQQANDQFVEERREEFWDKICTPEWIETARARR